MKIQDYIGAQPLYMVEELHLRDTREHPIQRAAIKRARWLGWKVTWFSRGRSTQRDPGWPDLSLWRTLADGTKQVMFVELKAHRGVVRPDQQDCHEHLGQFVPTFAIKIPKDVTLLDYLLEHGGDEGYGT